MVTIRLNRLEENFDHGTFGIWLISARVFCVTLEPADRLNERNVSSIPAQQYECKRILSPKYGEVFQVMNVPGRTNILIHAGNVIDHTAGCILLAQHFGKLRTNQRAVLNSGKTMAMFMKIMDGIDRFHLTVKEHY